MTIDEMVGYLQRTSLPTVVTEGSEDYTVFRRLEERFAHLGVYVLPAGGRNSVLEIFRRLSSIRSFNGGFIVDRDFWLFSGIPAEFQDNRIIVTDGYSIENDLYRDGNWEALLYNSEQAKFRIEIDNICQWFSHAVSMHMSSGTCPVDFHPNEILNGDGSISVAFAGKVGFAAACPNWYPIIKEEYTRMLRGKTLTGLIIRHLNTKGRPARHNTRSLMEIEGTRPGPLLNNIILNVERLFHAG